MKNKQKKKELHSDLAMVRVVQLGGDKDILSLYATTRKFLGKCVSNCVFIAVIHGAVKVAVSAYHVNKTHITKYSFASELGDCLIRFDLI
jgi:hypothetical protein